MRPEAEGAVFAAIVAFVDAVNAGEPPATVRRSFTASPTIVDSVAPFRWSGPGAVAAWYSAIGADASHTQTSVALAASASITLPEHSAYAYATVPGVLRFIRTAPPAKATPQAEPALLVFVLHREDGWKIETFAWGRSW
jgi:hypothetical protein